MICRVQWHSPTVRILRVVDIYFRVVSQRKVACVERSMLLGGDEACKRMISFGGSRNSKYIEVIVYMQCGYHLAQ